LSDAAGAVAGQALLLWREPAFRAAIGCLSTAADGRSSVGSSASGQEEDISGGAFASGMLRQAALCGRRGAPARARLWWREDVDLGRAGRRGRHNSLLNRGLREVSRRAAPEGSSANARPEASGQTPAESAASDTDDDISNPLVPWHRLMSEPTDINPDSPWRRQMSMPAVYEDGAVRSDGLAGAVPTASDGSITTPSVRDLGCSEQSVRGTSVQSSSCGGVAWERIVPHRPPLLLPGTDQARQFEFHPSLSGVMLTGDQRGGVRIVAGFQDGQDDAPRVHERLLVDEHPVVSLVWLRHSPSRAVCGIARTGMIRFLSYTWNAPLTSPSLQEIGSLQAPAQISSLSPSCGDEYLLASGLSNGFAVYDLGSGKLVREASDAHDHFINVSRFCHSHPHILATVSLDHTCKLWDLRLPSSRDKVVKVLNTGGPNVMCAFSPDDRLLLCSGIDRRLVQFELPSGKRNPFEFESLPSRAIPSGLQQYRRSMYFASGERLVTAATDESHLRVLSTSGESMGVVNMRGVIRKERDEGGDDSAGARSDSDFSGSGSAASSAGCERARGGNSRTRMDRGFVRGEVRIEESAASVGNNEYVQSVRTHPGDETLVGALMSLARRGHEPYRGITLVRLDARGLGVQQQT